LAACAGFTACVAGFEATFDLGCAGFAGCAVWARTALTPTSKTGRTKAPAWCKTQTTLERDFMIPPVGF
jgi:hypothetical protein